MQAAGKTILILGAARSGIAASRFLVEMGAKVILSDIKEASGMQEVQKEVEVFGVKTLWGSQPDVKEIKPDLLIVSPGIPLTIPPVAEAFKKNIPVISELELAYQFSKAPFIAVTGTNGKTTTTSLIGQLFKDAGKNVLVGGNIGLPLITEITKFDAKDLVVAEVSSFQLETIEKFKPRVSIILNFTPDHLDRHGSMANYVNAKARIFENQREEDFLILNYDDPQAKELANRAKSQVIFFSRRNKLEEGIYLLDNKMVIDIGEGPVPIICSQEIYIKGNHNLENAMAAAAAGYILGLEPEDISATLKSFPGVEHRLEFVREYRGIRFVNDSKGTNPDASIKALEAYNDPIILIAGGKNKGNDFSLFAEKIKERVKALVLVGQAAPEIKGAVSNIGFDNFFETITFEEAVLKAAELAENGDVVLLSPACASWDMFDNFEQRGNIFKELVLSLGG